MPNIYVKQYARYEVEHDEALNQTTIHAEVDFHDGLERVTTRATLVLAGQYVGKNDLDALDAAAAAANNLDIVE